MDVIDDDGGDRTVLLRGDGGVRASIMDMVVGGVNEGTIIVLLLDDIRYCGDADVALVAVVVAAAVVVSTVKDDNPRDILLRAHKLFFGVTV
jgi:hypothetical protein